MDSPSHTPPSDPDPISAVPVDPDENRRMFREVLQSVLNEQQRPNVAPPIVPAVPAYDTPNTSTMTHPDGPSFPTRDSHESQCKRRKWFLLAGGILVLVLAGVAVGLVFAFYPTPEPTPDPAYVSSMSSLTTTTSEPFISTSVTMSVAQETTTVPPAVETTTLPPITTTVQDTTDLATPSTSIEPLVEIPQDLLDLLSLHSYDDGTALRIPSSPQNRAAQWLAGNVNLDSYSDERKIQRYALATFYYSTNGPSWDSFGSWLTDASECSQWGSYVGCSEFSVILFQINIVLEGTIPNEIGLLSHLGEYFVVYHCVLLAC